jgi:hypothetical protein
MPSYYVNNFKQLRPTKMFISGFQKYLQKLESVGQTILVLIFY